LAEFTDGKPVGTWRSRPVGDQRSAPHHRRAPLTDDEISQAVIELLDDPVALP